MIVTHRKVEVESVPENACPKCGGAGQLMMIPYGSDKSFTVPCHDCNGEKIITPDLIQRKAVGKILRSMLNIYDLSMREAAKKFNQPLSEWIDATQGKLTADEIADKIILVEKTK